ncbi:MAG: acetylornithine deacetylase, partial [Chloroflexota bacterium]
MTACLPGQGGGPSLLFNGHVDTIPLGRAWPPRREGRWIWGRGAEDMKGGLVAMVHALGAVQRAGVR